MTIPASQIVKVNPGVVSTGGNPLSLNGVLMSNSYLLLGDTPYEFASYKEVLSVFGEGQYANYALKYFKGFDNSTVKPDRLFIMRFFNEDVPPVMLGGQLTGVTLGDIQTLSGTLIIPLNGVELTSAAINFAAATSFTDVADMIAAAFVDEALDPIFTVQWIPEQSRFLFVPIGVIGAGTTISYATGVLAVPLKLAVNTGVILQQGRDTDTPATAMDRMKAATQNWVTFTTTWAATLEEKTGFGEWTNAQDQRYAYIAWDNDPEAKVRNSTTCFGVVANAAAWDAVMPIFDDVGADTASFAMGVVASIDFSRANARITAAFKHQAGLAVTCDDETDASVLLENGYSFYGNYATDNDQFVFLYNGQISGQWKWLDAFVNQVYLNSQLQLAQMTLLTQVPSISYNEDGYNMIRLSLLDPINQFKNFGGIQAGVVLSEQQKSIVNSAAGRDVSRIIEQQGWYLQILDPGAQARGNRQTPIINFWYTDGGAVQKITIASVDIM